MNDPKSLDKIFEKKLFRIPDYQRGYAWQKEQLTNFWEDLINLSDDRSHYTGVLTLKRVSPDEIKESDNEYWLVEDHSYTMNHIVDGQQRLTTAVLFLQAFIDCVRNLPENEGKSDEEIFVIEGSLTLDTVINRYLFKTKPAGERTYKFGYTVDNPSYNYLRYKIFAEAGSPQQDETFYTLNLRNAKRYFDEQLRAFHSNGLQEIYKKITKKFLFNEYVIEDEFDVFVAFETMNNRGKRLSDLELLKNRLIYLTTLFSDEDLEPAARKELRVDINKAWKEVYRQLGRNDKHPLRDDDFLKAHWIMYFQYSRKRGDDYIKYLLDEEFSPKRVYKNVVSDVALDEPQEQREEVGWDEDENDTADNDATVIETKEFLEPVSIRDYVNSLGDSAKHWFNLHYPDLATELSDEEKSVLKRLNRIGMVYFRPLVMSVLKNEDDDSKRIEFFGKIERFIFIAFRLNQIRSNFRSSEFYNAARQLNYNTLTLIQIGDSLDEHLATFFHEDGKFNAQYFHDYLNRLFKSGERKGYYGWNGLRYFLYEYELSLESESRQQKVNWDNLLKTQKDKLSIEHVFPQTPTDQWKEAFAEIREDDYYLYNGSIGNLLLLSCSINTSLQNISFKDKKAPQKNDAGVKIRNGYSDGSHSEIEVAQCDKWTPAEIRERGLRLLTFMEKHWDIEFKDKETKEALLFLD